MPRRSRPIAAASWYCTHARTKPNAVMLFAARNSDVSRRTAHHPPPEQSPHLLTHRHTGKGLHCLARAIPCRQGHSACVLLDKESAMPPLPSRLSLPDNDYAIKALYPLGVDSLGADGIVSYTNLLAHAIKALGLAVVHVAFLPECCRVYRDHIQARQGLKRHVRDRQ